GIGENAERGDRIAEIERDGRESGPRARLHSCIPVDGFAEIAARSLRPSGPKRVSVFADGPYRYVECFAGEVGTFVAAMLVDPVGRNELVFLSIVLRFDNHVQTVVGIEAVDSRCLQPVILEHAAQYTIQVRNGGG